MKELTLLSKVEEINAIPTVINTVKSAGYQTVYDIVTKTRKEFFISILEALTVTECEESTYEIFIAALNGIRPLCLKDQDGYEEQMKNQRRVLLLDKLTDKISNAEDYLNDENNTQLLDSLLLEYGKKEQLQSRYLKLQEEMSQVSQQLTSSNEKLQTMLEQLNKATNKNNQR